MSNTKTVMGQASNQYVAPTDITDVFSTYLYEGNESTQTITNGIDLDGEGGLVWTKNRSATATHRLFDTERGVNKGLATNITNAEVTLANSVTVFNSNGFSLGSSPVSNTTGNDYASWTFRKAPKFFDVVTYTGDGVAGREIAHNLGSVPGMIVVKCLSNVTNWAVYHRGVDSTAPEDFVLRFNDTTARANTAVNWNDTAPTSTNFTVGTNSWVNRSGDTYVAYLFAHNDGDGEFGADNDADIIKCGSYTGNGDSSGNNFVDLGFEPQWLLIKPTNTAGDWILLDTMRGINDNAGSHLDANTANAESSQGSFAVMPRPTGFSLHTGSQINGSNDNYIYIAIRRGPLAPPESATEVFDVQFNGGNDPSKAPVYQSGFVTDMAIVGYRTGGSVNYPYTGNRLMGIQTLETHNTDAEESGGTSFQWDFMNGFIDGVPSVITDTQIAWMWKRAPNFFDVVAYTGNGTAGHTVSHNLGVAPEMMWVKRRDAAVSWPVFHKQTGSSKRLFLNSTNAEDSDTTTWNAVDPTATDFTVGTYTGVNASGGNYIAYLFATVPGVSKVGSYTGDGTTDGSKVIDCGFTSGARFVLIKKTSNTGHWIVFDTVRGIVSGIDPFLKLNNTDAENTGHDAIDPNSSGFIINESGGAFNVNNETYIFYAIA